MSFGSHFNITGGYFEPVHISVETQLSRVKEQQEDLNNTDTPGMEGNLQDMLYTTYSTITRDIVNHTRDPPWGHNMDNITAGIFNCTMDSNNATNCSMTGEVMMMTAPEPFPIAHQAALILVYSLTSLLAVCGNLIVLIVFIKGKKSRSDLTPFLINLACSDLIMAVFCIPFTFTPTMLRNWIFPSIMCPMVLYMQTVAVTASVSTNMAIGLDRFWVVQFPLKSRAVGGKRSTYVIVIIWAIALGLSIVQLVVGRTKEYPLGNGVVLKECTEDWPNHTYRRVYTFFILIVTYLLPLVILIVAYSIVGMNLWRRTAPGEKDSVRDRQQNKSKRKVVQMLVTIVALFGLCWFPLHLFALVLDFRPDLMAYEDILTIIYYCVHWLAMSNSFQNPIIYGFLNDSFKIDLRIILSKWFPCCCKYRRPMNQSFRSTMRYDNTRYTTRRVPTKPEPDSSSGSGSRGSGSVRVASSQQRLIKDQNKSRTFEKLAMESGEVNKLLSPSNNHTHSLPNGRTQI
ncbi:unnamed protein product [Owenia fusiformis]|uniref:Uncharacterized protein n=1 Tax=Owenia fusiformis TaxID=6347 RepID=A0A8J1U4J1_OWEFU|nr:unnamed protein product [Owenia fusiformis]